MRAFVNARVIPMATQDWPTPAERPWDSTAQAVLFGPRVHLVGSDAAVSAEARRRGIATEDLGGRIVLPGFVDAHTHFLHIGVKRSRPDLSGAGSLPEALRLVAAFLARHPGGDPVIAELWDESEWPGRERPRRHDLDALVQEASRAGHGPSDRPLVLRRVCGHVAVANSAALPAIRARWDDPDKVQMDTGWLFEEPSLYLNEVIPVPHAALDAALQVACSTSHALGLTAVGDYSQAPYREALRRAAKAGTLSVRVASSIYVQQLEVEIGSGMRTGRAHAGNETVDPICACGAGESAGGRTAVSAVRGPVSHSRAQEEEGLRCLRCGGPRYPSSFLRDGGLKVFLDGSLGARTAALRVPYLDGRHVEEDGIGTGKAGHVAGVAGDAKGVAGGAGGPSRGKAAGTAGGGSTVSGSRHGCVGHPHPNGTLNWTDGDVSRFFATATRAGIQVHAHAIGDAAIDQGLECFAALGAVAAGNPLRSRFEHFELHHDEQLAATARLGIVSSSQPNFVGTWSSAGGMYEERLGGRFTLANRFATLHRSGVRLAFGSDGMPPGPLLGLQAAVHHSEVGERLSWEQAAWHYTWAAAWSLHWEHEIGSLAPGMWADLVVLDAEAGPVAETIVAGASKYRAPSQA